MFCTNCGAKLPENAAVCPNCGTPVPGKEIKHDAPSEVVTEKITIETNPTETSTVMNTTAAAPVAEMKNEQREPEVVEAEIIEPEISTEKIVVESQPEVKQDKISEIIPELNPEQEPKVNDMNVTPVAGPIDGNIQEKVEQAEKTADLNNPHGTPIQDLPERGSVEHRDSARTPFDNVARPDAPAAAASNKFDFLWAILGFLFPLIGAILYFFWRTKKPSAAKWAIIGAAASILLRFITNLLGIGAGVGYGLFGF